MGRSFTVYRLLITLYKVRYSAFFAPSPPLGRSPYTLSASTALNLVEGPNLIEFGLDRISNTMRLACLQFAPQVGDTDNNLSRADAVLSKADPDELGRLDLLVLPELAFTGTSFFPRPYCES